MMKWGMEILSPQSYHHHGHHHLSNNSNWILEDNTKSTKWTHEENKSFENALALYDKETPDRWQKVAAMIPGKTVMDVMKQYKELEDDVNYIEAGLVPIPGYTTSSFTLDWVNGRGCFDGSAGKRSSNRPTDQERKKGVPWTEDEHRQFLLGLRKYGKGDWRNISRNFVISRTPTQVASHAQKYFIRQLSGGKDKRRSSIHDITTVNLTDIRPSSPDSNNTSSLDQSSMLSRQHNNNPNSTPKALFDWNQTQEGSTMSFNPAHGNLFVPSAYGMNSYGRQGLHRGSLHMGAHHNAVFQMQSSQCHPRG